MRLRTVGAAALLLEFGSDQPNQAGRNDAGATDPGQQVRDWCAALDARRSAIGGDGLEIVPGARTILLDGLTDPAATAETIRDWPTPPPADPAGGELVELRCRYDGPDLDEVARQWQVTPADVARIHSGIEYQVAFCGFAPGFGYLTGLPADRAVPRRSTPRSRVPAGAIGLADRYTGVYPSESPGGWQLIGSTDVRLFDPDREPPALLRPGTRVRFVPVPGVTA